MYNVSFQIFELSNKPQVKIILVTDKMQSKFCVLHAQ